MRERKNTGRLLLAGLSVFLISCNDNQTGPELGEPPVVGTASLPTGVVGSPYAQTLTATGGDGSLVWSLSGGTLPAGLSLDASGRISGTPTTAQTSSFAVSVESGDGQAATAALSITIHDLLRITTDSLPTGVVGEAYADTLSVVGGDGAYVWSVAAGTLPAGLALDAAGVLSGTPTTADSAAFEVQAVSGDGQADTVALTLLIYEPVSIDAGPLPTGVVGAPYSAALSVTGGDGIVAWSLSGGALPDGLVLDASGQITGTPTASGSTTFTVAVSTGDGQNATADFTLTVFEPLVVSTGSLPSGVVGATYTSPLAASGGDGAYTWSIVTGALPDGLTLDPSGQIAGAPTGVGSTDLTFQVTSGDGQIATADLTIDVFATVGVATTTLPTGVVGTAYAATLSVTGGDGTGTWAITAGMLPAGLALGADGLITGTPSVADSATVTFQFTSGDGQAAEADLLIATYDPVLIATSALPNGVVGTPFSQSLAASGGDGGLTWSLTAGTLPGGLSLDSSGLLDGTPTAAANATLTFQVVSGDGQSATIDLDLAVYEALLIGTSGLPNGVVGTPYNQMLSASGGNGAYSWSLTAGTLTGGLSLDPSGLLSGTPTAAASATLTFQVVTGDGQSATVDLGLATFDAVLIGTSTLPEAEVGVAYSEALTVSGGDGTYAWSVSAGAPPDGLGLDASGVVSGTATTAGGAAFTAQVTTGDGQTATVDLDLKAWKGATFIEGYAGATSIDRGESIDLFTSTDGSEHAMNVYRIGYYGGDGKSLVMTIDSVGGQEQAVPTPDPTTGLVEAGWNATYTLQTDPAWTSGVYMVELDTRPSISGRIVFVIRDDANPGDLLVQIPVTTYQAYNNWGGKSLYDYNSTGGRAYEVSFDRPYADWDGAGGLFDGDYHLIRWLEREGYQATYVTSVDLERDASVLSGPKVFVSNFHDEYWSRSMRENLQAAQDAGLNCAFFDANNVYWQIRFASSGDGRADRVMVAYKDAGLDPLGATADATVRWRDAPVNEPENALLGVMYESDFAYGTSYDWVVQNSSHWIYDGTGLADDDHIPDLIGYEYDRVWANGSTPAGLTILATSPVPDQFGPGMDGTHNAAIFTNPSGALVFSAGTIYWPWKLDDNDASAHGEDANVQQMTRNVLNHMLAGG